MTFNGNGTCVLTWWRPKEDWTSETWQQIIPIHEGDTPDEIARAIGEGLGSFGKAHVVAFDDDFPHDTPTLTHEDWIVKILNERAELRTNLKHAQRRCTELLDETRAQRRVIAEMKAKIARLEVR